MVEDKNSEKNFKRSTMSAGESAREYVARAKELVNAVRYHNVEMEDEEICRRILTVVPPDYHFVRKGFAI